MKRDDKRTLIVILIVCVICCIVIFVAGRKSNVEKLSYVDDYSTFFSITREVNDYIDYMNDYNKLNDILDSKYLEKNSIRGNNIYSPLSEISTNGIEYVKIGNNFLYFVKGKIIENDLDSINIVNDNFLVLVLNDLSSSSYSIYPVDDDNYKKVINSIKKINVDSNSNNKIVVSDSLSDVEVCKLYFSDFISMILNNTGDAYDFLNEEMRKRFDDKNSFVKYINENMNKVTSLSKLCKKEEYKDTRVYNVIDNNDNSYTFSENGVMNYKVNFYFKNNDD